MRKLHKKPLIMAAATLALTGTLAVGSAMAYFTTYSTAGGGVKMNMGFTETVPKEDVDENGKHITIENTGNYDCFVRVTAFAPVKLTYNAPKGGWTDRGSLQRGRQSRRQLEPCNQRRQHTDDRVGGNENEKEKEIISKETCPDPDSRRTPAGWKHCRQYTRRTHLLQ